MGYVDPNVPCNQQRLVRWLYGFVTSGSNTVHGWIPTRLPRSNTRTDC